MGTSRENQRSGDEEEGEEVIAWKFVPYRVRQDLIKRLNPDVTMSGNDWRMLASELGYTTADINFIESEKDNNTKLLFNMYDTKPQASLNEVYTSLEKMQRTDCLDILKAALPEIQENCHKASQQSPMFHRAENSEMPMSGGPYQWSSAPCPYPSFGSMCGGHTCYPCSHGCPAGNHSHHPPSCPSPYHSHTIPPHLPICQPFSHIPTQDKTCHQGFPSPVGHSQRHNVGPSSPGHHGNSTSGFPMPAHRGQSGMSQARPSFQGSPTYSYNDTGPVSFNMPLPNNISALDNSNLNSTSSSTSDSLGTRQKVARQYSDECNISQQGFSGDKRFRNNSNIRQSDDASDGLDYPVPAQGMSGVYSAGQGQHLQMTPGEMGGVKPRQSPEFVRPGTTSAYVDPRDRLYQNEVRPRNEPISDGVASSSRYSPNCHRDTTAQDTVPKTSLAHLEKLAAVPGRYQPTDEYKTVVAEQKIEAERRGKGNKDSLDSTGSYSSSSSGGSGSSKNQPSLTFPMRVKAKHDRGMEGLASLTISKKSSSLPENMKPKTYRKAFRHIKVFVTYSYDSKQHAMQVYSLCKFLTSNGFACCVDMKESENTGKTLELIEWCRKRAAEADFILVCVSPKYLEAISTANSLASSAHSSDRQLHTREIYELMNEEYLNSQHNAHDNPAAGSSTSSAPLSRFVPLLFGKMTASRIPMWMRNGPAYSWPAQYMDLAWMLTKPQERIRARRGHGEQSMEEEERDEQRNADQGATMAMSMGQFSMDGVLCSS